MFFFFKQKTAYEMRISDWSSDVCSSDLISILRGLCASFAALALLAGCSSTARQVPVPYAIELTVDPQVNPDVHGRPSPVQITVYELSSSSAFESRDFFALQSDPQAALGKELLNTDRTSHV